jgi:hypothetical protein
LGRKKALAFLQKPLHHNPCVKRLRYKSAIAGDVTLHDQ